MTDQKEFARRSLVTICIVNFRHHPISNSIEYCAEICRTTAGAVPILGNVVFREIQICVQVHEVLAMVRWIIPKSDAAACIPTLILVERKPEYSRCIYGVCNIIEPKQCQRIIRNVPVFMALLPLATEQPFHRAPPYVIFRTFFSSRSSNEQVRCSKFTKNTGSFLAVPAGHNTFNILFIYEIKALEKGSPGFL